LNKTMSIFPSASEWIPPQSFPDLSEAKEIAIDLETCDPNMEKFGPGWPRKDGFIVGYAVAVDGWCGYYPIAHGGGGNLDKRLVESWITEIMLLPCPKVMHNAAYDLGWLWSAGFEVKGKIIDTMIAAGLVDENRFSYALNSLGFDLLKEVKSEEMLKKAALDWGVHPKKELWKLPANFVGSYGEQDAALTLKLWHHLEILLRQEEVESIFELETEILPILTRITFKGIRFDREAAKKLIVDLQKKEKKLMSFIRKESGLPVDMWAAVSIAKAFDALGIDYPKTEKGAPSFTKSFLESCEHPIAKAIVEAREINKTHNTFLTPYLDASEATGRIHSHVSQLRGETGGTVTGRLCVHGDTVLELDIGPVKIGEYEPTGGERIKTHTGQWRRVVRRYDKGLEEMVQIITNKGSTVSCTGGHRVLSSKGWVPVRDLTIGDVVYHVDKQKAVAGRGALSVGPNAVPVSGKAYHEEHFRGAKNKRAHDSSNRAGETSSRPKGKGEGAAAVSLKNGGLKSHEGKVGAASPQLQGRVRGREGICSCVEAAVVHGTTEQQAYVSTSSSDLRGVGPVSNSTGVGDSPCRRGPYEQPRRELGVSYEGGSPNFAQEVTVAKIIPLGKARVWDIEVEGDHSYIAGGLIHHNSMNQPNLQQVPARHPVIGPLVRGLFLPEEGQLWAANDFSAQEPRLLVHYAKLLDLPGADKMATAYNNDPETDFHQMVAFMADITRKQAKTIGLGLMYGMGKAKLAVSLDLQVDEASELIAQFHAKVPFLKGTISAVQKRIEYPASGGSIRTLLGRKCRFPLWEPMTWGLNKALPYEEAAAKYGTRIKRAMTYRGLNKLMQGSAADQTKKAMLELHKAGYTMLLSVHDEIALSVDTREEAEAAAEIMRNCVQLEVPSKVDVEVGPTWGKAE
jgi:DNA polymerase I-like protein with 3'-5' exonuclease and polymerase domains